MTNRLVQFSVAKKVLNSGESIVGVPKFDDQGRLITQKPDFATSETQVGSNWIDGRPIYRKVVDFGALPNADSKTVAHGITGIQDVADLRFIIKGAGSDWRLVPYVSLAGDVDIAMSMDGTNIYVDTESDWSSFTGKVVIDYTRT